MAKLVKWNIRVEHEVVFLRLSLLWGFSENVLYLDNYTMLFCFFEYWYICVLHLIFFEIFVSEIIYFIHQIVMVQSVWHSLSLRNNLFVLPNNGHRPLTEAIWLRSKDDVREVKIMNYYVSIFIYCNTKLKACLWSTVDRERPIMFMKEI